jgi:hypothetical protein
LTSVEQSLIEHVSRGEWLDLAVDGEVIDEAAMRSWDDSRACRAAVLRDILRGRVAADPDPHGLRLRGARITGRLDLENLATDVGLELHDCLLEEGLLARDARLAAVVLVRCQIEHPTEPPLDGARLTCSVLGLDGARVNGHSEVGAVDLHGAQIGNNLACDKAEMRNDFGPALFADGLQIGQDMFLRGFIATGTGGGGTVRLTGAHIGGSLLSSGAHLSNDSGPALVAYGLQVGQSVFLGNGFTAIGVGERGAVRLIGGHIGGRLDCTGAELRNDSGPALRADSLQIDQSVLLTGGFTATGGGDLGAVHLPSAHIGGSLECDGAHLRNDSGAALYADRLQVDQSMFLRYGFTASGSTSYGAIYLVGAHIDGHLDCTGAELRNDSGPALDAYSLQVGQGMYLGGGFTAVGGGEGVAVNLTDARVGGKFVFAPVPPENGTDSHRLLAVDGLTYAGVPETGRGWDWQELLRLGTPAYAAQPYQQLAAGYGARGDDRQARQTLMAQRDDQLARAPTHRGERWWGRLTKVTLGYGYQPWRALLFLAAVVAVSGVLAVALGTHGALAQTSNTATPGRPCTLVQQVSVGLDLNLPVGTSVARVDCDLTANSASVTAAWLTAVGWVLRLLAWAFAALFIAGFTSAVRKT